MNLAENLKYDENSAMHSVVTASVQNWSMNIWFF